jgi:glucose dehydrogenase
VRGIGVPFNTAAGTITGTVELIESSGRAGSAAHELGLLLFLLLAAAVLGPVAGLRAADGDWPVYLGDKASTHFSTLKQIDRNNVQRLLVAWTYHSGDARQDDRSQIQCLSSTVCSTAPRRN